MYDGCSMCHQEDEGDMTSVGMKIFHYIVLSCCLQILSRTQDIIALPPCCPEIYHCPVPVLHASHALQICFIISATFHQYPYLIFTTLNTLNQEETQPTDKQQQPLVGLQAFKGSFSGFFPILQPGISLEIVEQ